MSRASVISSEGAVVDLGLGSGGRAALLQLRIVGASKTSTVSGEAPVRAVTNIYVGSDPDSWSEGLVNYARVRVRDVYAGIDAVYYGRSDNLEYDFVVRPGYDPRTIRLRFDGASRISIGPDGALLLEAAAGSIRQEPPRVFQDGCGRQSIPARYAVGSDSTVAFEIGSFDPQLPLVIDPELSFSTYYQDSTATSAAVDKDGAVYITGECGPLFRTRSAFQAAHGGNSDGYVMKLDPTTRELVYSSFIGGQAEDHGLGVAVDSTGAAYVCGFTASLNFPLKNPVQGALGGTNTTTGPMGGDGFLLKVGPNGSLDSSTYFGGLDSDSIADVAVTPSGQVALTGFTESPDFPILHALESELRTRQCSFVAVLSASRTEIIYSTYIGADGGAYGTAIAVDADGAAYVTGATGAPDFPIFEGLERSFAGFIDGFVVKLAPDGQRVEYASLLGGATADIPEGIAVDNRGAVFITGGTDSVNFPTTEDSYQPLYAGGNNGGQVGTGDAFVVKIAPSGSEIEYSTFVGGSDDDYAFDVAVDGRGSAFVTGFATSEDFPTTTGAIQTVYGGDGRFSFPSGDAFVTALTPDGGSTLYSTYLGNRETETGFGIAVGGDGTVRVVGVTFSRNFPTTVDPNPRIDGTDGAAFIAEIASPYPVIQSAVYSTAKGKLTLRLVEPVASEIKVEINDTFVSPPLPARIRGAKVKIKGTTAELKIDIDRSNLIAVRVGGIRSAPAVIELR